jgi:hypothetical protein
MDRARLALFAAGSVLAAALLAPGVPVPAGAQGVPTATPGSGTGTGAGTGAITFRCPGVTDVSATADATSIAGRTATSSVRPITPAEAAESPCVIAGADPDLEWSADYIALRMTSPGTWRSKMRIVLEDFDTLHRQYVANPRVKDMGMWPARLEETFQLAGLIAHQSGQDVIVYYAGALRDEYKAGIFDEHPLLVSYGLQARAKLDELTAPPPSPIPHPRARR